MFEDKSEVLYLQQESAFERTVEQLNDNKVIVLPCDTIYGLCAKMGEKGERELKNIKIRGDEKPFLVLSTLNQVQELCEVPDDILKLWPCPLTAILNRKDGGTLAVRVPLDPFLQAVLEKVGSPIYSTSINVTGRASLTNIVDIILTYKDREIGRAHV